MKRLTPELRTLIRYMIIQDDIDQEDINFLNEISKLGKYDIIDKERLNELRYRYYHELRNMLVISKSDEINYMVEKLKLEIDKENHNQLLKYAKKKR